MGRNLLMTECRVKALGQAVQGRGHALKNIPCQDMVFFKKFTKTEGFTALADGAGSCSFSEAGAEVCTKSLGEIIRGKFFRYYKNKSLLRAEILAELLKRLRKKAEALNADIKELSSTLLFVYWKAVNGKVYYISGHIGDGLIIKSTKKGVEIISYPENGKYLNTTYFITSSSAFDHLRIYTDCILGDVGFLLMSDGTAESLYTRRTKTPAPACSIIFNWIRLYRENRLHAAINRNLENLIKQKTADDCSLTAVYIQQKKPAVSSTGSNANKIYLLKKKKKGGICT